MYYSTLGGPIVLGSNPCNWAIIENRWGGEQDVKPEQVSHRVKILTTELDPNLHSMPMAHGILCHVPVSSQEISLEMQSLKD